MLSPDGSFVVYVARGRDAVADDRLIASLATAWSAAYRASSVPAQRDDDLYAEHQQPERVSRIRSELSLPSALVAYVRVRDEVAAFFWGSTLAELETVAPDKATDIRPYATQVSERVAYLSMLGVRPELARRGLGKVLTRELCHAFTLAGAGQALARTINELALTHVYRPLGFVEYRRFEDARSRNATRIIFGASLPLTPLVSPNRFTFNRSL
jgi:ribosomal protein S18 acetylase RimI-like enzyme